MRDADRVRYLDGHLRAAHAAIAQGADLRGYLVWSLLDNFEWAEGYRRRFGVVFVDYATRRRVPKDSALWFRDVIRRGRVPGGRSADQPADRGPQEQGDARDDRDGRT